MGFKPTGRRCAAPGCGAALVDHILDWEDALPEAELEASEAHASAADLALCLGTSLQITPACDIPLRTVKAGGRLAILNLQRTPKDRRAQLVLHSRVDTVMAALLQRLGLPLPRYERRDRLLVAHQLLAEAGEGEEEEEEEEGRGQRRDGGGGWGFSLQVHSVHGQECPTPMVQAVRMELRAAPGAGELPEALAAAAAAAVQCEGPPPFRHEWRGLPGELQRVEVLLTLQLVEHADEGLRAPQLSYAVQRQRGAAAGAAATGEQVLSFATQQVDYSQRQQELVAELGERAAAEAAAGPSKQAAGGGKRKRAGAEGAGGEGGSAAPAVETRPHVTRTGRQTRTVVLRE